MQEWFQHAKLGIWVHWGLYSVNGIPESWSFYNEQISYDDYMKQAEKFTANRYDPKAWAALFKRAGARYAVLTTKHHDGVALWDTQCSDLSVVNHTPAGRDLIRPYAEAMREAGLKVGFYYSHLDWSHPDYASDAPGCTRSTHDRDRHLAWIHGEGKENWERFLAFHRQQLRELCEQYGEVDLWWFDGDWRPSADDWNMQKAVDLIHDLQPNSILNSRICGLGDYATPEQAQPVVWPDGPWEYSLTLNDSWGYQTQDTNHKSPSRLIRLFTETIGAGGNLLLGIGPYEDGTFQPEQVQRLEVLGNWIHKHEEAVYETQAGLPPEHHYGPSTLSLDKQVVYVMVFEKPCDVISVKGIVNRVKEISVLGHDKPLHWYRDGGAEWIVPPVPSVLRIELPEHWLDPYATIIKIELDGPLELYRGSGSAIEDNQ